MRTSIFALLVAVGLFLAPALVDNAAAAPSGVAALQAAQPDPAPPASQPSGRLDVNIDTDADGAWYASPIWIAVGVIAVVLIIALVVMAGRGGGTTVVKG